MSIWRRAVQVAKSNLNDIAERATSLGKGRSLEQMSDAELEAELARRRAEHAAAAAAERIDRNRDRGSRRASSSGGSEASVGLFAALSPKRRQELRRFYANLELPFGASLDEVKHAYRRLMRQYHPDKHQGDPARRELATQLSQKLTRAYNELSRTLRELESPK